MVFEIIAISAIHKLVTKQDYLKRSLLFALIAWGMAFTVRIIFNFPKFYSFVLLAVAVWITASYINMFKHEKALNMTFWTLGVVGIVELIGVAIFVGFSTKLFGAKFGAVIESLSVL